MRAARILLASIAVAAAAARLSAFTVEPMSALLAPSGRGSVATFRIANPDPERVALRLRVLSRSVGPGGVERNEDAGGLLAVYPARLVVEPGATAAVKVQWRGLSALAAEACYRLVVEQVGVDAAQSPQSGIRVMFRYIASLYVGQASFKPRLEVSATPALGEAGQRGFAVDIANRGTRHVVAVDLSLDLAGPGGEPIRIPGSRLGHPDGANYLPGATLSIFVPDEAALPGGRYDARASFADEY